MRGLALFLGVLLSPSLTSAFLFDKPPRLFGALCLSTSILDLELGDCRCPQGQKGDGTLCCVPEGDELCIVRGDPVLTSINGQKYRLDFPCTHTVASVSQEFKDNHSVCKLTVSQSGQLVYKGAIYNNHFLLKIETRQQGLLGLIGRQRDIKVKYVKLWDHYFRDPLINADIDVSLLSGVNALLFDGHEIDIDFDKKDRVWHIKGCDSQISIRANDGMNAIQKHIPGICISGARNNFDGHLCTKDESYDHGQYRTQSERLLSDLINDRAASGDMDIENDEIGPICDAVAENFVKCSTEDYPRAMAECGNILLLGIERACLSVKRSNPLVVFKDCLAAFCGADRNACERLKTDEGAKICYRAAAQKCDSWVSA